MLKLFFALSLVLPSLAFAQGGGPNQQCMSEIQAIGCGQPGPSETFRTCIESKRGQLSAQCQQMGRGRPGGPGGAPGGRPSGQQQTPPPAATTTRRAPQPPAPEVSVGEVQPAPAAGNPNSSGDECLSVVDGERSVVSDRSSGSAGGTTSGTAGASGQ